MIQYLALKLNEISEPCFSTAIWIKAPNCESSQVANTVFARTQGQQCTKLRKLERRLRNVLHTKGRLRYQIKKSLPKSFIIASV